MKTFWIVFISMVSLQSQALLPNKTLAGMMFNNCYQQGNIKETGRGLDIAISGEGWITLKAENGSLRFTRYGSFGMDKEGYLVHTPSNLPVVSMIDDHLEKINLEKIATKKFAMNFGYEPGRKAILTAFNFTEGGDMEAIYSDGDVKTVASLHLAVIENQRALEIVDKEKYIFKGGKDIGSVGFVAPMTNATGKIMPRALESQDGFQKACK